MTKSSLKTCVGRLLLLSVCVGLASIWAAYFRAGAQGALICGDIGAIYYSAKCALEHKDPYDPGAVLREIESDGQRLPAVGPGRDWIPRTVITISDYPPTAFLAVAPLAMLRWPVALKVWLGAMDLLLVIAAYLVWDFASRTPALGGWLAAFTLLNCEVLFWFGNPAGIVVPFCVIATWCFLKNRFRLAGVALLAAGLVMKPQDAGFVWLYFLLAGGMLRRRALQTLAVAGVLCACALVWIETVSPHWVWELRRNLAILSAHGGVADPGPSGALFRSVSPMIQIQVLISILRDEPRFYNFVSYLLCGSLIVVWAVAVLKRFQTQERAFLALAAIALLSLPAFYHFTNDAKILLLTVPGCSVLWAAKGVRGRVALGLTWAAVFVTSDVPIMFLNLYSAGVPNSTSTLAGKLKLLVLNPAPLVLLVAGCFYLWVFVCWNPPEKERLGRESAAGAVPLPAI